MCVWEEVNLSLRLTGFRDSRGYRPMRWVMCVSVFFFFIPSPFISLHAWESIIIQKHLPIEHHYSLPVSCLSQPIFLFFLCLLLSVLLLSFTFPPLFFSSPSFFLPHILLFHHRSRLLLLHLHLHFLRLLNHLLYLHLTRSLLQIDGHCPRRFNQIWGIKTPWHFKNRSC